MKKRVSLISSLAIGIVFSGTVFAAPVEGIASESEIERTWVGGSNGFVREIDKNPSCYQTRSIDGRMVENWIKNDIAYTAVDGVVKKTYQINSSIKKSWVGGSDGFVKEIDTNPSCYQKLSIGGQVIENWIQDDVAYTAMNGTIMKAHEIKSAVEINMTDD